TPDAGRARGSRQGSAAKGAALEPRRFSGVRGAPGSRRAARAPSAHARARAGADPLRPHARVAVYVLPWRGAGHGERLGGDAALGPDCAVLWGRAPLQLRLVRLARA